MSQWKNSIFVPDKTSNEAAFARTTHLAIGAHHDDLEIFAIHGILAGYKQPDYNFAGVTVTDGSGSPRTGEYTSVKEQEMILIRHHEQVEASQIGRYSFQVQLGFSSASIKEPTLNEDLVEALTHILNATHLEALYLHNPADKHPTHIALLLHCIEALKRLSRDQLPRQILGCEVWRGLDWLSDNDKIILKSGRLDDPLPYTLIDVFKSQIHGGKNYTDAVIGRRLANATFYQSHKVDSNDLVTYAMDLRPIFEIGGPSLKELVASHLRTFSEEVLSQLPD